MRIWELCFSFCESNTLVSPPLFHLQIQYSWEEIYPNTIHTYFECSKCLGALGSIRAWPHIQSIRRVDATNQCCEIRKANENKTSWSPIGRWSLEGFSLGFEGFCVFLYFNLFTSRSFLALRITKRFLREFFSFPHWQHIKCYLGFTSSFPYYPLYYCFAHSVLTVFCLKLIKP